MTTSGLVVAAITDVGCKRKNNEDSILSLPEYGLFCVADGMGGAREGQVASKALTDSLHKEFTSKAAGTLDLATKSNLVREVVNQVNAWIQKRAEDRGFAQMGSTLVLALFDEKHPSRGVVLHAGDSRSYRFRQGTLVQLTTDHSFAVLVKRDEKSLPAGMRGVVTNAIGKLGQSDSRSTVNLTETPFDVQVDDIYIICSDGLTRMISDKKLLKLLIQNRAESVTPLTAILVDAAKRAGGDDNISVVMVKIAEGFVRVGCEGSSEPETARPPATLGIPQTPQAVASTMATAPPLQVSAQKDMAERDTPTPTDRGIILAEDIGASRPRPWRNRTRKTWIGVIGAAMLLAPLLYMTIGSKGGEKRVVKTAKSSLPPTNTNAVAVLSASAMTVPIVKPVEEMHLTSLTHGGAQRMQTASAGRIASTVVPSISAKTNALSDASPPVSIVSVAQMKPENMTTGAPPPTLVTPTNNLEKPTPPDTTPIAVTAVKPSPMTDTAKPESPEVAEKRSVEAARKLLASSVDETFHTGKWGDLKHGLGPWADKLLQIEPNSGKRGAIEAWMILWSDCSLDKIPASRAKDDDSNLQRLAGILGVQLPVVKLTGDAGERADLYCASVFDRQIRLFQATDNFTSIHERQLASLGDNLGTQITNLWVFLDGASSVPDCGGVCDRLAVAKTLCTELRQWARSGLTDNRPITLDGSRAAQVLKVKEECDAAWNKLYLLIQPAGQQLAFVQNRAEREGKGDVLVKLAVMHGNIVRGREKSDSVSDWRAHECGTLIHGFLNQVEYLNRALRTPDALAR